MRRPDWGAPPDPPLGSAGVDRPASSAFCSLGAACLPPLSRRKASFGALLPPRSLQRHVCEPGYTEIAGLYSDRPGAGAENWRSSRTTTYGTENLGKLGDSLTVRHRRHVDSATRSRPGEHLLWPPWLVGEACRAPSAAAVALRTAARPAALSEAPLLSPAASDALSLQRTPGKLSTGH